MQCDIFVFPSNYIYKNIGVLTQLSKQPKPEKAISQSLYFKLVGQNYVQNGKGQCISQKFVFNFPTHFSSNKNEIFLKNYPKRLITILVNNSVNGVVIQCEGANEKSKTLFASFYMAHDIEAQPKETLSVDCNEKFLFT